MYQIKTEGMTCSGCIRSVTKAIQRLDAGAKVDVDLAIQEIRVESGLDEGRVKEAVAAAGYPVLESRRVQ